MRLPSPLSHEPWLFRASFAPRRSRWPSCPWCWTLQEAFATAWRSQRRPVVPLPRPASKTIKSLWLPTMPVADLATELTLLEHGFMQNIDIDALLAWRAEHAALARAYGDSSPRTGDDARGVHAIVPWLEWSRRSFFFY